MVLDTSAVMAILLGESQAPALVTAMMADPRRLLSAFSLLESSIVVEARKGPAGGRELDLFLHRAEVRVISLDSEQVELARSAWQRFGKGRHPAGLNIGDCCAYALAAQSGEPLLFVGQDFGQTDVPAVAY